MKIYIDGYERGDKPQTLQQQIKIFTKDAGVSPKDIGMVKLCPWKNGISLVIYDKNNNFITNCAC